MDFPNELHYTKDHEWIHIGKDSVAKVGVSHYAVEQLGDIVHIELPDVGASLEAGAALGTIESTKTVSDLYMPLAGKVKAVNKGISDSPENIQNDPYDGWLIEVELSDADASQLMSAADYETYVQQLED